MNITKEQIDSQNAILKVEVAKADYLPKVEEALKKARKNVNMKGFRQGMVPLSLVKKMHGNALLYDEVNKLVTEQINNHIKEEKLDVLGQPMPKADNNVQLDINHPEDVTLEFELGLAPEFNLDVIDKKTTFNNYIIKVDDKLVDEEVEGLRLRHGVQKFVEDSVVEEGDILHCDVIELENGAPKENGVKNSTPIGLNIFKEEEQKKFYGLKIGDYADINLFEASERDRNSLLKFILDIKEGEEPEGLGENFRLMITKIGRMEKADLNEALFDKLYGEGVVKTEEELRAKLVEEMDTYFSREAEVKTKNDIIEYLLEEVKMEFPSKFLKRWIKATNEKPITDEQIENDYDNFEKGLKWSLITNKLGEENDIKAEKEEIESHSMEQLRKQLEQYNPGGNPISDADLQNFNASMMAREDHVKKTYDAVMEQKLFTFIKDAVTIKDKEVTLDEFRDLNTKK
ncbi:MAG: trigger factor [Chitinophagales bacterium]